MMHPGREVLLVEDDVDLRDAIAEVLRDEGCRVLVAEDGEQALAILETAAPDLIVTDLMMPRMNGWDFCAAVRRKDHLAGTPVAVVSAFVDVQPIDGVRIIRKPLDVQVLASLLSAV